MLTTVNVETTDDALQVTMTNLYKQLSTRISKSAEAFASILRHVSTDQLQQREDLKADDRIGGWQSALPCQHAQSV
jgi:hypothetical protein